MSQFIATIKKINSIDTRGKFIVCALDSDVLLIHLRMEGKFIFRKKGQVINIENGGN